MAPFVLPIPRQAGCLGFPVGQARGWQGPGVGDRRLGYRHVIERRQLLESGRCLLWMHLRDVREIEVVLVHEHVVGRQAHHLTRRRPPLAGQPGQLGRRVQARSARLAEPDPDERRLFTDRVRAYAHPVWHVRLRGHAHARAGRVVSEAVVAAHQQAAVQAALGQRVAAMSAAVLERDDVARLQPVQHDRAVQQLAPEEAGTDLVAGGGDVPAVQWVVRIHRSSTNRLESDRETHSIMASLHACSSSLNTESRWSGVPSMTAASHVPQIPSRQEPSTLTPASSSTSNTDWLAGTVTVIPERWQTTSKLSRAPDAGWSAPGLAANRSRCKAPAGQDAQAPSTALNRASGPQQ